MNGQPASLVVTEDKNRLMYVYKDLNEVETLVVRDFSPDGMEQMVKRKNKTVEARFIKS